MNIQIRIPGATNKKINKLAKKSRAEFVRKAIQEKIQRELDRQKEEQWINALRSHSEDTQNIKDWLRANEWGET